jgi:IPT/TIG domain
LIDGGVSMTIPRFLSRWWRPLLAIALVLAAVTTYALARGDGAPGGEFSASPTTSSAPGAAEPTTEPGTGPDEAAGPGGGVSPPTGNAPTGPTNSTDPSPGAKSTTGPSGTSRETTTRSSKPQHWVIRWIMSLGPEGPTSPIFFIAPYLDLRDGNCAEALNRVELDKEHLSNHQWAIYRGAATACLAAFHQQPRRWAEARRHLADAQSSSAQLNCPERVTLAWLQLVVGLHEQDPDRAFVVQKPQGFYTAVERIDPTNGKAGDQITVEGNNLDCATKVTVSRSAKQKKELPFNPDQGGRSGTFKAPAGFSTGPVRVTLKNEGENYTIGHATFTYKDSSGVAE